MTSESFMFQTATQLPICHLFIKRS